MHKPSCVEYIFVSISHSTKKDFFKLFIVKNFYRTIFWNFYNCSRVKIAIIIAYWALNMTSKSVKFLEFSLLIPERRLKSLIGWESKHHRFQQPLHNLSQCGDAPCRNHLFGWCLSPILQLFQKSLKVNESPIYLNWICLEQHLCNHQWKCCSSHSLHSKLLQHALRIHNMKSNTKNAVSAQFL